MSDPTAQTPAGPGPDATGTWAVSLAEIDAMGRKAARGAGMTWGLAEEAGRAARTLAAHGLPGPETLAALLTEIDRRAADHAPGSGWQAPAGTLCPVALGAAVSDIAARIAAGERVRAGPVLFPLLLVPFLAGAARDLRCRLALAGPGLAAVATPEGLASADWTALEAAPAAWVEIGPGDTVPAPVLSDSPDARVVPVAVWRALDQLAWRTYVPASEASRRRGAGEGS